MCFVQPLIRGFARYRTCWKLRSQPDSDPVGQVKRELRYLGCAGDRCQLLEAVAARLTQRGWKTLVNDGWSVEDLSIRCASGSRLSVVTMQEWYRGGWSQVVVRFHLTHKPWRRVLEASGLLIAVGGVSMMVTMPSGATIVGGGLLTVFVLGVWRAVVASAKWSAAGAISVFDTVALQSGFTAHKSEASADA